MSQDNQNRDRQDDSRRGQNTDEMTRQGRGPDRSDSDQQHQDGANRQNQSPRQDDQDELDEDRDDDQRTDGSGNRRNNIG